MNYLDKLLENKKYKEMLDKLPEKDRENILKALQQFIEEFETKFINPIRNLNSK